MDISDYLSVLRRRWYLLPSLVALGVLIALAISMMTPPKYTSEAQLLVRVQAVAGATASELQVGASFSRQSVITYAPIATSSLVLDRVIQDLSLTTTVSDLAAAVDVFAPPATALLTVRVSNENAGLAQKIAASTAKHLGDAIVDELENPLGAAAGPVLVETVNEASMPKAPVSPNLKLLLSLGLLFGLAGGVLMAFARAAQDKRIYTARDLKAVTLAPILGPTPWVQELAEGQTVDGLNKEVQDAAHSILRMLPALSQGNTSRTYAIAGSNFGAGGSTVTSLMALGLANSGSSVVVVDADSENTSISKRLGIQDATAWADLLRDSAQFPPSFRAVKGEIRVISAATPVGVASRFDTPPFRSLLKLLGDEFDYVLVDSPPVAGSVDAVILSRLAGGTILVIASGSTTKDDLAVAAEALNDFGGSILAIVPTKVSRQGIKSREYSARFSAMRTMAAPGENESSLVTIAKGRSN
ncbi:Wzz/FepE/Etk N-terminal domain-containing protein [Cryobacterium soli]|uniref:Wzz/FepE/Etk N-terminal domain-containing protein n=1 Tax=Cryobacterium soli TaxID=2220095 RepID=UPI000E759B9D|nr:Wzz/FepE/Etk N-terminal domain-containing protein [Cryobacterium soli]